MFVVFFFFAALWEECARSVDSSTAAMGLQPSHEHRGAVCPSAGGLGGGADGPLPQDPRASRVITYPMMHNQIRYDLN